MHDPRLEMRAHASAHVLHRRRLLDGEIDQGGAEQIERGEEIEIGGEAEMVGDGRRDQPPDQVAGDVAGDVGGKRARRVGRAVMLAEIGKREGEGSRHAQPLRHAKQGEGGEVRRMSEQSGGNCEHEEAEQDALSPVDLAAEITDGEPRHRHAHGAGIDGKSHRGGADAVMLGERGENGLGGEQVDDGQEGSERDDDEAEDCAAGMRLRLDLRSCDGGGKLVHGGAPRKEGCDALRGEGGRHIRGGKRVTCSCRSDP